MNKKTRTVTIGVYMLAASPGIVGAQSADDANKSNNPLTPALFGTREELKNNYLYRFAGARLGIYGNSGAEAIYVGGFVDANGQSVDASKHRYVLRFAKGGLPPNDASWSLTMYDGKTQLLVANPLKRYLINSTMESQLKRDAEGGVTLYVQAAPAGADKESNWLPAPKGPFYTILRIYQPKPAVQKDQWKASPLRKAAIEAE